MINCVLPIALTNESLMKKLFADWKRDLNREYANATEQEKERRY